MIDPNDPTISERIRSVAVRVRQLEEDFERVERERDEARASAEDYRNLFHDACGSIAHIATAAGFSPTDENVEPPDVAARVENMRAALSKAEKERDEALQRLADARAPVNGVDPEEVLNRADIIGTDVDWDDLSDAQWRAMVDQITAAPALAREVVALRLALLSATRAFESGDFSGLGTANSDLQPLLDAAIARLRGVEREGDAARADLADLQLEHDAWGVLLDAARRDRDAARGERDEARRRLDADHGIAPNDNRPSNHLLTLTPHLLSRIEALGYVPGETPAGVLPWLVSLAETEALRRRTP